MRWILSKLCSHEKLDEIFLVSFSNTVVNPRTMVIHPPGNENVEFTFTYIESIGNIKYEHTGAQYKSSNIR